jgi:pyrroline-5-carboxylate reductase
LYKTPKKSGEMRMTRVAFIGAGKMAEAIIRGILAAGLCKAESLMVSDPSETRRSRMVETLGIRSVADNREAARWGDVVVLGVKPPQVGDTLAEMRDDLNGKCLISIAAGIPLARLVSGRERAVIRAMPNTPAQVGAGATALAPAAGTAPKDIDFARQIFEAVGAVWVLDEKALDAVTGLSGSGPAYVFVLIEALADGGVKCGLPRDVAQGLAAQTVFGAAKMVRDSGRHPAQLKDDVASPGGTTIAGLHQIEMGGVRAAMIAAVEAAARRSAEIGQIPRG